jgi:hypothetical protein
MTHDRQPQTQTAMRTRGTCVSLAEPLEHVRQQIWRDAHTSVGHDKLGAGRPRTATHRSPALVVMRYSTS